MLDAELHRVLEHHVGETASRAKGLQAPLQPLPREAVLERLVETLQRAVKRLGDGLANRRSHERVEDADQGVGVLADRSLGRALQSRCENFGEMFVAGSRKGEGAGQHGTDGFGELCRIVELLLQCGEGSPILLQENAAQRFQLGIPFDPGERSREVPIDAARHLDQEVGKPSRTWIERFFVRRGSSVPGGLGID